MGGRQHVCGAVEFSAFPASALGGSLVDRFAEQVERHRACVAVVDRGRRLSYGALDEWANGIAHAIGPGNEPVALAVGQGAGYAAAVLGVLKTGRAYVPLEPTDPPPRLAGFLLECGARIVVSDTEGRTSLSGVADTDRMVEIDAIAPRATSPEVDVGPDTIAYIFFTSGSTGAPKGVYDSHRNVLHNILRYTNALAIAPTDRLTLLQGPAFSGCVSSQFGALLNGAASYPFRMARDGLVHVAGTVRNEGVTIFHSVPSIFRAVATHGGTFPEVRIVRLEGDRATSDDVDIWRRHFAPTCVLANGLGTTETGLARQLIIGHDEPVANGVLPVGYAVQDMDVVVVDEHCEPVTTGVSGEIAVRSRYLALGYWNRPDLTAEKFLERNGLRTYLTGDLGRMKRDGCLEYLGRRDGGLKVLGQRVEPAEIEEQLVRLDGVKDVAVVIRQGRSGDGRIVAYVVPDGPRERSLESLRRALGTRLPEHMLPTGLVRLDALPLGANGKVDRDALPDIQEADRGRAVTRERERWLASIWSEVLRVAPIGADQDFFALGGDSLAAAEVLARIEVETGSVLPLGALVRARTVAQLAALLDHERAASHCSTLTVMRDNGTAPPLVLIHGNNLNVLHYRDLVVELEGWRPLWGLEYRDGVDLQVDAIVTAHRAALAMARPRGPYLLAGFCSGAPIAHELGRRLQRDGHDVRLALLGITPLDFPTVVAADAYRRWWRHEHASGSALARACRHAAMIRRLPPGEWRPYVVRRGKSRIERIRTRLGSDCPPTQGASAPGPRIELESHHVEPCVGRPLVVLHREDTLPYTEQPARDWAGLGTDGVDAIVVPGSYHTMLEPAGVRGLASLLRSWAPAETGGRSQRLT